MLWLYNTDPNISFYQVFLSNNKVYSDDNNIIYNFEHYDNLQNEIQIDINIKYLDLVFKIKVLDNIISFNNLETNDLFVFSNKMNFIKPTDNELSIPLFQYSYKKINTKRMPNLIESNYTFVSELHFRIYNINKNLQFIIETNPINNYVKKYFVTNNLNEIINFMQKNIKNKLK